MEREWRLPENRRLRKLHLETVSQLCLKNAEIESLKPQIESLTKNA